MKACQTLFVLSTGFLCLEAEAGAFRSATDLGFSPGIVVHPRAYTGTGGSFDVSVCIDAGAESHRSEIERAIEIWNQLAPTTQNCADCGLHEEGPFPEAPFSSLAAVLHELGHCGFGLGHADLAAASQSFTTTREYSSISAGSDVIRGTNDDVVTPLPGARLLHWFRTSDNNPFAIDGTIIDQSTFSRQILQLPSGHLWPASGNRAVGEDLGFASSQTVMYSVLAPGQRYSSLVADEISTTKLARTGLDLTAATADDYSLQMVLTSVCSSADIVISMATLPADILALCSAVDLVVIPPSTTHFRVDSQQTLDINHIVQWDVVFGDNFESGSAGRWSAAVP